MTDWAAKIAKGVRSVSAHELLRLTSTADEKQEMRESSAM